MTHASIAAVSRVEENENTDDDGNREVTYTYYVKYKTQDGKTVEAKPGNETGRLFEGALCASSACPRSPGT